MRRYAVPGLITVIAAGLLVVLALGISSQSTNSGLASQVRRGTYPPAPDANMSMPLLGSSKTTSLAALRGGPVLVNVFASWCDACQVEAPLLRKAQAMLKAHGGTVIGVSYQDNASNTAQYMRKYHLDYPVLRDVSGQFAQAYGVTGVPETFLINRRGQVRALSTYQLTKKWIDHTLVKALNRPA